MAAEATALAGLKPRSFRGHFGALAFTAMIVIAVLAVVLDAVWKRARPTPPPVAATR